MPGPVKYKHVEKVLHSVHCSVDWSSAKGDHGKIVDDAGKTVHIIDKSDLSGKSVRALARKLESHFGDGFDRDAFLSAVYPGRKKKKKGAKTPKTETETSAAEHVASEAPFGDGDAAANEDATTGVPVATEEQRAVDDVSVAAQPTGSGKK